ncbi:MAG: Holliday junction resolvase YqgF, putative holliday junction resolvase [Candidatus Paceibacter sp.]|jgi:putative Holliday junction resolvase|nr:Holliday junction resolvase YqgF, putative holliday junction resolvase [Candidatus Paceibacter sp.]
MGIDFGTKRVGVAVSDSENKFAIPHSVIQNSKKLIEDLNTIICDTEVEIIILGESKDFKGQDNKVMPKIRELKDAIENQLHKQVIFEPEFLTSHQAQHIQGKTDLLDASAAAIILQSYLDRLSNSEK